LWAIERAWYFFEANVGFIGSEPESDDTAFQSATFFSIKKFKK